MGVFERGYGRTQLTELGLMRGQSTVCSPLSNGLNAGLVTDSCGVPVERQQLTCKPRSSHQRGTTGTEKAVR